MRLAWILACREENIDPAAATRLPLLFAIDAKLAIPGGLHHRIEDFGPRRDAGDGGDGGVSGGAATTSSKGSGKDSDASTDGSGDVKLASTNLYLGGDARMVSAILG